MDSFRQHYMYAQIKVQSEKLVIVNPHLTPCPSRGGVWGGVCIGVWLLSLKCQPDTRFLVPFLHQRSAVSPSEKCRFSCREVPFLLQRSATSLGGPTLGKTLSHHGKLKKVRHLIILTPPLPLPYTGGEQLPPISPQVLPSHVGEGQGWGQ